MVVLGSNGAAAASDGGQRLFNRVEHIGVEIGQHTSDGVDGELNANNRTSLRVQAQEDSTPTRTARSFDFTDFVHETEVDELTGNPRDRCRAEARDPGDLAAGDRTAALNELQDELLVHLLHLGPGHFSAEVA